MERRVLVAVLLSFVVLFAYQSLVKPQRKPATTPAGAPAAPVIPQEPIEAPKPVSTTPAPAVLAGDTAEKHIVIETSRVKATFSNRGGILESWLLKDYLDSAGRPMDLVPPALTLPEHHPFSMTVGDKALSDRLNTALYQASSGDQQVGTEKGTLTFTYRDAAGVEAVKTIEIQPDGQPFLLRVATNVVVNGQRQRVMIHGGAGFGDIERGVRSTSWLVPTTYQPPQAIFQTAAESRATRVPAQNIGAGLVQEAPKRYGGVDDQYFLAALITGGKNTRIEYSTLGIKTPEGERVLVDYRARVAGDDPFTFFLGPKEFDLLRRVDAELVRVINFGMFGFLATPLLRALKWVNEFVGNFGWSIIILTILINVVMFPLRHKSAVSMRKMQQIQPQVKAIQDRYAKLKMTDPARQKMNQELMELYKSKGANPASGCVPMLLTVPVLFAFYALLSQAIELRGAPWIFWIHDLSRHDPFYVTPLLMGVTQFWQSKMMPATGDPAQQKMMQFMPIIFLVFFLGMPSGLVLYWLVSNLWTVGQQYFTNRWLDKAHPRPAPAK
jgi:YidC/Oxa1 family membrane protein insertase